MKKRLIDKYDFLVSKNRPPQNQNSNNWIVNISKHELTEAETSLLNKGLNFSLPNSKKNIPQFIATIENVIDNNFNKFTEVDKTIIRHNVCASLKSVKDEAHQLNREERETLNALKNNQDILIAPADKGCSMVLMDKSDYFAKVQDHQDILKIQDMASILIMLRSLIPVLTFVLDVNWKVYILICNLIP